MKKIITLFMCLCIISGYCPSVFAYEYPKEFWKTLPQYEAVCETDKYEEIIKYGVANLNSILNQPLNSKTCQVITSRCDKIGRAYLELGDYTNAYEYFYRLKTVVDKFPDEYSSYYDVAKKTTDQLAFDIKMYTDKGTPPYYGAVNEHKNGVLFGTNTDGGVRKAGKLGHESMILTYQELGQGLFSYCKSAVTAASQNGWAVEFALNCPKEGNDIKNIKNLTSYLKEISDLFDDYPDVPIFLRFAAEFNIWNESRMVDAQTFIEAFRYVSQYFKSRHSNVAIVWSPNHSSNYMVNVHEYYPGDEYVDWIGLSSYAMMYHMANTQMTELNAIWFKCGNASSPVIAVKEFIETYGDRKPIMLSESGSGHYVFGGINLDTTEFALRRLREYYTYLPMVYPQIKLIAHFDNYVSGGYDDFRLSNNAVLTDEYVKLTKGNRYIQNSYKQETGYCYREIGNGTSVDSIFEVSTYVHKYADNAEKVSYFIDGNYVGESGELPFTTLIDGTNYSGSHNLRAVVTLESGKNHYVENQININSAEKPVTVEISGNQVEFDQEPILYNNRTMVPMRKIFEELGADVYWDEKTQTATGKRGDRAVKVTVGQKTMYINSKAVELDTAPLLLSERTLVPARAVAEGLGCDVEWDDRYYLVSITPKVFQWSDWSESLPKGIDYDLYYIEEKEEYQYKVREREYFTSDYKLSGVRLEDTDISYGNWSGWSTNYVSESDTLEVETRTQSEPMRYYYEHYCTGNISDKDDRYRTWDHSWRDECDHHVLGWFDYKLDKSPDTNSTYEHYVDGERYRCSNTCYRWYQTDTEGGSYTEYRSRPIYYEYTYSQWGDWSRWSDWDEEDPYDDYDWYDEDVDIEVDERTVYRYKEK